MTNVLKNDSVRLRNGWWILAFNLALGAPVVPATILASVRDTDVGPAAQAALAAVATGLCLLLRFERPASVLGTLRGCQTGVPSGLLLHPQSRRTDPGDPP